MAPMPLQKIESDALFDTRARLTHLNMLRSELELEPVLIPEQTTEVSLNPTIGIEIEMTWAQAFRNMQARWLHSVDRPTDHKKQSDTYKKFAKQYNQNDRLLKPILQTITPVIPRVGFDAYWEFSFRPVKDTLVADQELSMLYEASVLFDDITYPTHMTIAGIESERDASTILTLLEQAGGTTPERLEAAVTSKEGSWARKGRGGHRHRAQSELEGDDTTAYEFRTLITTSPEQMSRLLQLGQELAHTCLNHKSAWRNIQADTERRLEAHGLPLKVWESPRESPELWKKYGETLLTSTNASITNRS